MTIFHSQLIGKGVSLVTPTADGLAFQIMTTDGAGNLELGAVVAAVPGALAVTDVGGTIFGAMLVNPSNIGGNLIAGHDGTDPNRALELGGAFTLIDTPGGLYFAASSDTGATPDADKEYEVKLGQQITLSDGRTARRLISGAEIVESFIEETTSALDVNLTAAETTIVTHNVVGNFVESSAYGIQLNLSNDGSQTVNFIVRIRFNGGIVYESNPIALSEQVILFSESAIIAGTHPVNGDVVTLTVEPDIDGGNTNPFVLGSTFPSQIRLTQFSAGGGGGGSANISTSFYLGGSN